MHLQSCGSLLSLKLVQATRSLLAAIVSLQEADAQLFGSWIDVQTLSGRIRGHVNGTRFEPLGPPVLAVPNIATFLGIPYAEPPVGVRRFRPPEPRTPWDDVLEAKKAGPVCAQLPANALVDMDPKWTIPGEDCLYLNIWAPIEPNGSLTGWRPVLVYLHGGGYIGGSGFSELDFPFYDSSLLAQNMDAIVVTLNYRVGVFGFLADPVLLRQDGTTGNYGLQDQRLALRWVHENVKAFGGDAARVTLMGESAGAASVLHHLVSPRSQDFFSQAAALSPYLLSWNISRAYQVGRAIASHAGCGPGQSLSCLQHASTDQLLEAERAFLFGPGTDVVKRLFAFGPVSDGYELAEGVTLPDALQAARVEKPAFVGSNMNESNLFFCIDRLASSTTREQAQLYIAQEVAYLFPHSASDATSLNEILDEYLASFAPDAAIQQMVSDVLFSCTADKVANSFVRSSANVYRYLLARAPRVFRSDPCLGVPHMADLWYIFRGAFPGSDTAVLGGDEDVNLSRELVQVLSSFVHRGSPGPAWRPWDTTAPTMQLGNPRDANFSQLHGFRRRVCKNIEQYIFRTAKLAAPTVIFT